MLVIGDTGHSALTKIAVKAVGDLVAGQPERYVPVIERIGEIVHSARTAIETGELASLGPLMDENHALLRDLTVSSPELETLVTAARDAGALGAKLSGGGRGGNMIALVDEDRVDPVTNALHDAGAARVFVTRVE
jgi:mevalonate kinase